MISRIKAWLKRWWRKHICDDYDNLWGNGS
jgi:hypothetical protein